MEKMKTSKNDEKSKKGRGIELFNSIISNQEVNSQSFSF